MNKYQKGRRFEYEVIKLFKDNGYEALRTAGSHSPFDIVLVKYTDENKKIAHVAFVQCKIKKLAEKAQTSNNNESSDSDSNPLSMLLDS